MSLVQRFAPEKHLLSLTLLAFSLPVGVYFFRPSTFWNFDGVACAAALELGDPLFLFHSNHLIYGFLGSVFWKLVSLFTGPIRALPALQVLTTLFAGTGLAAFYRLLVLRLKAHPVTALLVTWTMAASAVFWVWSLEAQVYTLGFAALAWGSLRLMGPPSKRKYAVVGCWHALGVLGHLMNLLWIVPTLYWLETDETLTPETRRKARIAYLGWLAALVLLPYLIVIGGVVWSV